MNAAKQSMNNSFQFDPDATSPQLNAQGYGTVSPKKLEKVRQNMEMKEAIKFRNNTSNKGYGFHQVVEGEVEDRQHDIPAREEDLPNPYVYNFRTVANNEK